MTQRARHDLILQRLAGGRELTVEDLARDFAVNVVTVRRDLARLAARGLLRRTHGGAVSSRSGRIEFEFNRKQQTHQAEKSAIADAAVRMIQPAMAVSLDTGTTTLELARRLARVGPGPLQVLTSSLAIAAELYRQEAIELVLLGGTVRKDNPDMAGMLTEENLRLFRVNVAFVGADAVSPAGLFTTDSTIARVSAAIINGAETAVLLADHSKFSGTAFVHMADWSVIDAVVTDAALPPDARAWLEQTGAKVTYAETG